MTSLNDLRKKARGAIVAAGRSGTKPGSLRSAIALVLLTTIVLLPTPLIAASDLALAPGLSFTDDSSPYFPIRSTDPGDGAITNGRPTLIFIGTSHCWNTAREAERIVTLYPRYKDNVHFYRN